MNINISLEGTTPYVCHNIRLADPDDPFTQAIAEIVKKRTKTEDDRREVERLEWYGGLYTADGFAGPVTPTGNLRKCFNQAAKIRRQGAQINRALIFTGVYTPIVYDGPRDIDALWAKDEYRLRLSVGVNQARTMRMRPKFPRWLIVASAVLLEDVMDLDDLRRIVEQAGVIEGLGDNRINGYGRFKGEVTAA